jgi:hypothetical protein
MPLRLDRAKQVTIDTARITGFYVQIEPLGISVQYSLGIEENGAFTVLDTASEKFEQADIEAADPKGGLYAALKEALYQMLKKRLAEGTIT